MSNERRDLANPEQAFAEGQDFIRVGALLTMMKMALLAAMKGIQVPSELLFSTAEYLAGQSEKPFVLEPVDKAPPMIRDDANEMFRAGQGAMLRRVADLLGKLAMMASMVPDPEGEILFRKGSETFLKAEVKDIAAYLALPEPATDVEHEDEAGEHCESCPAKGGCDKYAEYMVAQGKSAPDEPECNCPLCSGSHIVDDADENVDFVG